jgi:outer membrane protein OmpA-like peptidoglycan-associated protein
LIIPVLSLCAQDSSYALTAKKKLLVRDSLDYTYLPLIINTTSNEFSPIPFKGGLMYISNKPIQNEKLIFNRIYWTKDTGFKIIDQLNVNFYSADTTIKFLNKGKTDDFTAPTSNDNDILIRYKKIKRTLNSVEISFINFSTDQAFAYNDSSKLLIYAKKSNSSKDGIPHCSLWQAYLLNGKLKHKKRILFEDSNADYLYPFLTEDGSRLYLSSNIKNGKGGYDIYYVNIQGGLIGKSLIEVKEVNTQYDEISPFLFKDSLFFSSNREGGLGGFDAYYLTSNIKLGVKNIGYPVNSEKDEIGIKKDFDNYYLTSNRNGNFDILNLKHSAITYTINGSLTYSNDGSMAPYHLMYIKDKETGIILDTIRTDKYSNYSFLGKPNREYEITTLNGDSAYIQFSIKTYPHQQQYNFLSSINGTSPKQKTDSLNLLWAMTEKRKNDSTLMYATNSKFVVHYDFDKSIISSKEKLVLDSLIKKLAFLPKTFISIGAFTDCIGSYKYNYRLSVKRGKAVVDYLLQHGLDKQRITANGYSKKYTISPCITKYTSNNKLLQQNSRRAEIVLSENKKTDWATLELQRGKNYYTIYNSSKANTNLLVNNNINKDSINKAKAITALNLRNENLLKVKLERIKQDSINKAKAITALNLRNENLLKAKLERIKQDSITSAKAKAALDLIAQVTASKKRTKDSLAAASLKTLSAKPNVILAKSDIVSKTTVAAEEDMTKEEILKSLDILAKLKLEQERIVEYLTKRINKKPILIYVSSDSVSIEIYDNGIHDNDSVSVIYNKRIVVDKQELKVNKPIKFKLKVDKESKNNELVFVAENLGTEPPNTGVMFITEKSGRRQQVVLSTDMTHNEVIYFIRIEKQ